MALPFVLRFLATTVGDGTSTTLSVDILKDPIIFITAGNAPVCLTQKLTAKHLPSGIEPNNDSNGTWSLAGTVATFMFHNALPIGEEYTATGKLLFSR